MTFTIFKLGHDIPARPDHADLAQNVIFSLNLQLLWNHNINYYRTYTKII